MMHTGKINNDLIMRKCVSCLEVSVAPVYQVQLLELSWCFVQSPHGADRRPGVRPSHAAGDSGASSTDHDRLQRGRGHQLHPEEGEALVSVRLLQRQKGSPDTHVRLEQGSEQTYNLPQ